MKQILWDVGYAMVEPFIRMDRSSKQVMILIFAVISYTSIAEWLGIDPRVTLGTDKKKPK